MGRTGITTALGVVLALHTSPVVADVLGLERVASQISRPMFVTHAPGDTGRLFIAEKGGVIRILHLPLLTIDPTPFLTIPDTDTGGDGGLQSIAFHPDFIANGRFYVHVTVDNGGIPIDGQTSPFSSHIRAYTVSVADPNVADPTPTEILSWVQPRGNHNGGWIGFNPPGTGPRYLYVMSGDGGKQRDPDDNAQTLVNEPLGKVLRIDVDGDDFPADDDRNYAVPSSNPFVGETGDDEIWAYGLRNPWRASFDRETGDLWIGDVGQDAVEEIDFQASSSAGGENYAWNRREGLEPHQGGALQPGDVQPVYDYDHGSGNFQGNSVVGGYVYRGPDASLRGLYFFADTVSANVWTLDPADPFGTVTRINDQLVSDTGTLGTPVSFGEDADGNLYIVDHANPNGEVFRIVTDVTVPTGVPGLQAWAAGALVLMFALVARSVTVERGKHPIRRRRSAMPVPVHAPDTTTPSSTGLEPKVAGLLTYLLGPLTGILFLVLEKQSSFVRFHAMQSTLTFVSLFVISLVLGVIPLLGGILSGVLSLLQLVLWVFLMFKAFQGEAYRLPVVGDIAAQRAGSG